MYDDYAAKVLRTSGFEPKAYQANSLNTIVLTLPFAEAHMLMMEMREADMPRLGETLPVQKHAQDSFLNLIHSDAELHMFTMPFIIQKKYLQDLQGWREWRTWEQYLEGLQLQPIIVFKNRSLEIEDDRGRPETYYLADMRVLFRRETAFDWKG